MARVAVIGAGAVGGYYGARLAQAGHDVRFLFRRDLAAVRRSGLTIESPAGGFRLPVVQAFGSPDEMGEADWVICSLKATALHEAGALVAPVVGPNTRVLALMNGLGVEERFVEWFGAQRVFGGMAFVCINRGEPGVIRHLEYGRVSIGHFEDDADEVEGLQMLLESGGIEVTCAANLRCARWEKLCWNIPFNGLSVAAGGVGTKAILADGPLRATAERVMRDVAMLGNVDLGVAGSDARLDVEQVVEWMFRQTESMGDYRTSMVIDYLAGRPLEVEAIIGEPVRRAASLGVAVPAISTLYALVRAADRRGSGELEVLARDA